VGLLDAQRVASQQTPVVLDQVRDRDQRGHTKDAGMDAAPQPDQTGHERERVRGDVRDERAPHRRSTGQSAAFVERLPLGLEEVVAHQMAYDEHRKDLYPGHPRGSYLTSRRSAE